LLNLARGRSEFDTDEGITGQATRICVAESCGQSFTSLRADPAAADGTVKKRQTAFVRK
jgi:hypothetical protein